MISHTNAAREEVKKKVAHHPAASAFLGYPPFNGTVTAFLGRYIVLPYLCGLGWSIHLSPRYAITGATPSTTVLISALLLRATTRQPTRPASHRRPLSTTARLTGVGGTPEPSQYGLWPLAASGPAAYQALFSSADVVELLTAGIVGLLRRQIWRDVLGQAADSRNLWRILAAHEEGLVLKVRRLLLDRITVGNASWNANAWNALCDDLTVMCGIHGTLTHAATAYLEFVAAGAADHDGPAAQRSKTHFEHDGVTVRLGLIQSLKGMIVGGLLVVETEV